MKLYRPPIPSVPQLEQHFVRMTELGFQLGRDLEWTYSFVHWSAGKLLELQRDLESLGYRHKDTSPTPSRNPEIELHRLVVERVAQHTPESLHDTIVRLAECASRVGVDYDGWEVGKRRAS
jgi:hypothetical protein